MRHLTPLCGDRHLLSRRGFISAAFGENTKKPLEHTPGFIITSCPPPRGKKQQNSFTDVDVRHKIFLHSQTSRFLRLILFALFRENWIWDGGRTGHWCSFSCWFILSHHQPVCPLLAPHLIHQLRSIRRLCSEGSVNQRRHHATLTPAVLTLLAVCMSSHPVEGKINWL